MFYGRERELAKLNELYDSDQFEFVVMYGRRRVGKTSILTEFIKQKKDAIFFVAQEYDKKAGLDNFSQAVYNHCYATDMTKLERTQNVYAVRKLMDEGIISGYEDGSYRPEDIVTYAEFAILLSNILCPNDRWSNELDSFKVPAGYGWAAFGLKYCFDNKFLTIEEVCNANQTPSKRRAWQICEAVKTYLPENSNRKNKNFMLEKQFNIDLPLTRDDIALLLLDITQGIPSFGGWEQAFTFLSKKAKDQRLIVILDEFPYLANADRSLPSILQSMVDHVLKETKLMLIICGSSMSFMEKLLSSKNPIYGRITSQMVIDPFDYYESRYFAEQYDYEQQILTYGVLGGIPQYLASFQYEKTFRENVIRHILSSMSYLYEEPKNLLRQELREPMVYNSIIEAIAKGASRLSEISTKVNVEDAKCAKYISSLIELKILEKETPFASKPGKKTIYRIKDNFFKFWYQFVFANTELIEQSAQEYLYDYVIAPHLSEYIGRNVFEQVCIQFLRRLNQNTIAALTKKDFQSRTLPFVFRRLGRWWGTDSREKKEVEIDIIADSDEQALFCECKWRNEPIGSKELKKLIHKAELHSNYSLKYFALFSKSGFTQELIKIAEADERVLLFALEDLYQ